MYALVENGSITKYLNGNKGVTIGEYQYPKDIFTKWTNEERVAIGVYPVRVDATNKKDPEYYINTDITYTVSGNEVVGSYGTATAKPLDDILFTQADADANDIPSDKSVGDVKSPGLKNVKIAKVKQTASSLLSKTDWYVIKATEVADYTVPSDITTYRAAVRTKSNEMETSINNAADVDALKNLYENDKQTGIPNIGEWPEEVV